MSLVQSQHPGMESLVALGAAKPSEFARRPHDHSQGVELTKKHPTVLDDYNQYLREGATALGVPLLNFTRVMNEILPKLVRTVGGTGAKQASGEGG